MPVIRNDAHVSDGFGDHAERDFSYASFEQVLLAMNDLRELNADYGYYFRKHGGDETYNLGTNQNGGSPRDGASGTPTGVLRWNSLSVQSGIA